MENLTGGNPTQSDVARAAGVSRGLVSRALSGDPSVTPATRKRIMSAAEELGYTRNLGAATLAARRSPVMGVVLPDLRNPFFESIVDALQSEAAAAGLLPLIATASNDRSREATILHRFREFRVAGVAIISPVQTLENLAAAALSLNMVLVGAPGAVDNLTSVHVDEAAAARLIVRHASERGWRKIISISEETGPGQVWAELRRDALAAAAREAGIPFTALEAHTGATVSWRLHELLAGEGSREANGPDNPIDALQGSLIVGHNDLVALDLLAALRAMGYAPGRDVGVIGFDDTHLARRPEFDITSVSQDDAQLARLTVEALTAQADNRRSTAEGREWAVTPSLSVRSSS